MAASGADPARGLPPPLTRAGEQAAARHELARLVYARARPSLQQRLLLDLVHLLERGLARADSPSGAGALVLLLALAVLAVVALRARLGPLPVGSRRAAGTEVSGPLPADTYRAQAAAAAAGGDWGAAVLAGMRGLARGLEQRGVLEPRPGRTARELATEAGAALPGQRELLTAAAATFDEVVYGARPAAEPDYQLMVRADRSCAGARPDPGALVGSR